MYIYRKDEKSINSKHLFFRHTASLFYVSNIWIYTQHKESLRQVPISGVFNEINGNMTVSLVLLAVISTICVVYSADNQQQGRRHCFYMESIDKKLVEFLKRPSENDVEEFFKGLARYYSALDKLLGYLDEKKPRFMHDCEVISKKKTPLFLTKSINMNELQYYCKNKSELFVLIKNYITRIEETYEEFLSACSKNPQFLGKPEPPEYLVDTCSKALDHLLRHPVRKPSGFYQLFNNMSIYYKNLLMFVWLIRNKPLKKICDKAHRLYYEGNYDFLEKPLNFKKIKSDFELDNLEFIELQLKMKRIQKRWKLFKDVYHNTFVEPTTVISFATEYHIEEPLEYSAIDYNLQLTKPEPTETQKKFETETETQQKQKRDKIRKAKRGTETTLRIYDKNNKDVKSGEFFIYKEDI